MRSEIVEVARGYLGVRWRHQGRSKEWGVDCAGFAVLVGRDVGIQIDDIINYRLNTTDWPRILRTLRQAGALRIFHSPLATGDIMIFEIKNEQIGSSQAHFGIVSNLTPLSIIHAYQIVGRVVENVFNDDWLRPRYIYRLPLHSALDPRPSTAECV